MIVQLQADRLLKPCIEETPNFSTNDKSNLPDELIDQKRAEEALKMGLKIKGNGFNVFASGDSWSDIKIELFLNINCSNE
jgi:hypothetical protein